MEVVNYLNKDMMSLVAENTVSLSGPKTAGNVSLDQKSGHIKE